MHLRVMTFTPWERRRSSWGIRVVEEMIDSFPSFAISELPALAPDSEFYLPTPHLHIRSSPRRALLELPSPLQMLAGGVVCDLAFYFLSAIGSASSLRKEWYAFQSDYIDDRFSPTRASEDFLSHMLQFLIFPQAQSHPPWFLTILQSE
jgi:hypothetical protein